ncbi:hypothetical protein V6C32_06205 [Desulforamulus ruminis]|uniref:hypothetical protein n=1 Tax=Desulforamulus ruminis TaxID=1564 RepID=UPI00059CC762|nr:hypothetical protein [Desulforamulus ruminis]
MALYGPAYFNFSDYVWSPAEPGKIVLGSGDTVVVQFTVNGSWSFSVQLYNIDTGRWTVAKTANSSNPQVTFTDMLAGNYRAYIKNNLSGTWAGYLYILW